MAPKKDYEDYTKYINDAYQDDKSKILNKIAQNWPRNNSTKKERTTESSGMNLLASLQAQKNESSRTKMKFNRTFSTVTPNERKLGSTFTNFNLKPLVLERKLGDTQDF